MNVTSSVADLHPEKAAVEKAARYSGEMPAECRHGKLNEREKKAISLSEQKLGLRTRVIADTPSLTK